MRRLRSERRPVPRASLLFLIFALGFLLAAGTAHIGGQVAFFMGAGLFLIIRPPRWSPHPLINAACLGLLAWSGIQLLPGTAAESSWRDALNWAGLLESPTSAALSSFAQFSAIIWLVAAFAWLFVAFELNAGLDRKQRRFLLTAFSTAIAVIGIICFAMNSSGQQYALTEGIQLFSFLPNRNHMALLCVLGGVVGFALAFERIARHRRQGLFLLGCTLLAFLGVLSLTSRAAVFLFLLGMSLSVLTALHRRRIAFRLKLVIPFGVLLLAVLLTVGQITSSRLLNFGDGIDVAGGGMSRFLIYKDTLAMLPSVLWTGSGWSSFETVFPYFREASLSFMAILHPESDWLWLWAESGLVGLALVLLMLVGLGRAILRPGERAERLCRIPALALFLAFAHSFVDVPLHNASVFIFIAWLAGLALTRPSSRTPAALWLPPAAWRGIGVCLVGVGGLLAYGAAADQPWSRSEVEQVSLALLERPWEVTNSSESWLKRAADLHPFVWTVHTGLAQTALARGDGGAAEKRFLRARAAQADQGIVTWTEARLWEGTASGRVLAAYRSTFLERRIFDRETKFTQLLHAARGDPALFAGLARISRYDPALRELLFSMPGGAIVSREMELELADHPRLENHDVARRALLFQRFGEQLGWSAMAAHFDAFPSLREHYPLMSALAQCEVARWADGGDRLVDLVPEPPTTRYAHDFSRAQLEARHRRSPDDVAIALAYLRELVNLRDWQGIADLTAAFHAPKNAEYPPSMHYWGARGRYELFLGAEAAPWWRAYVEHLLQESSAGEEADLEAFSMSARR